MPRKLQPKRPLPDPEARAAPPRQVPRADPGTVIPAFLDEDLAIPPPRTANSWYCDNCGQPGGVPDPGMMLIDPRYAVGICECSRMVKGVKTRVKLIADFHFDRDEWDRRDQLRRSKKAYDKGVSGVPLKPDELALMKRFQVRNHLSTGD